MLNKCSVVVEVHYNIVCNFVSHLFYLLVLFIYLIDYFY